MFSHLAYDDALAEISLEWLESLYRRFHRIKLAFNPLFPERLS